MFYHWLIGMDIKPSNWNISDLTLWMISILSVYLICGKLAERENGGSKYYKIIRYGKLRDFWREVCFQQIKTVVLFVCLSFFLTAGFSYAAEYMSGGTISSVPWEKLVRGTVLYGLNHSVMGAVQALAILAFGHSNLIFMAMVLMELLALFFSTQSFMVWNPFHWDMVVRSDIYYKTGFPFWIITAVQLILLLMLFLTGHKVLENRMG